MKSCTASECLPIALETPHCTPVFLLDVILPMVLDLPAFDISNYLYHFPGPSRTLPDLVDIRFNEKAARGCLFN